MRVMRCSAAACLRGSSWALAVMCSLAVGAAQPSGAINADTLTITNRPRPVMRAVLQLMAKYGYVITYEEPRYVYQGDLKDVTGERRDLNRFRPGKAPKVLRPLGGSIELPLPSATDEQTTANVLQQLVRTWLDSNQGGAHFQVEQQDSVFHVLPTEVRDVNGNWESVRSVLTKPISLPRQPRTELEMFKAICSAIGANAGAKVVSTVNGGFMIGAIDTKQYVLEAQNEPADSVLMRAFKIVGKKMTWILTYEPTLHIYFLNIDDVRTMPNPMIWPPS